MGIRDHVAPSCLEKDQLPTCPGGLVGDHEGLALGMALTDVHGLGQVEHGKEAASVMVGRPAAVVFLGDGAMGKVLVLCSAACRGVLQILPATVQMQHLLQLGEGLVHPPGELSCGIDNAVQQRP